MENYTQESCEQCSQLSVFGLVVFDNKKICSQCYKNYLSAGGDIIQLYIDETGETIYLPLAENLEAANYITSRELIQKWGSMDWGYYTKVDVEIIPKELLLQKHPNLDLTKIVTCNEFWDLYCFEELAIKSDLYNTPWEDEPYPGWYSSSFAVNCDKGLMYSKDFAYFDCPECSRTICEQNPAQGWHVQYRKINEQQICLKCLQEITLDKGIPVDEYTTFKDITAYAMFYNRAELSKNDWMSEGSYKDDNTDFEKIKEIAKTNWILIDLDRMAIGGLEYYWSLYIKSKENG